MTAGLPDRPEEPPQEKLGLLGHDLRAAVSDIISGLHLVSLEHVTPEVRMQLERVRAAGEILARLVDETLSAIAGDQTDGGETDCNTLLSRIFYDLEMRWAGKAREKGMSLRMVVDGDVPGLITSERIAIERLLSNILSNALKHADAGEVRLAVSLTADQTFLIKVSDEGPGFSPDALERLFEYGGRPAAPTKPGQGLGLHISQKIARSLGGKISVANLPKRGAEVTVELPGAGWMAEPSQEATGDLPDFTGRHVLIAEDSETNRALLRHMLTRLGATCEVASDGHDALEMLDRQRYDLALIDIEMPRLSGLEVIRAIRSVGSGICHLPVIAITAYVLRANRDLIYAAGADAILPKPLAGLETFASAIADTLTRKDERVESHALSASRAAPPGYRLDELLAIAGPGAADDLLDRLGRDLAGVERDLTAGLGDGDLPKVRAATHVLIALSAAVGADTLQSLAEQMNLAAHRGDLAALVQSGPEALRELPLIINLVSQARSARETAS